MYVKKSPLLSIKSNGDCRTLVYARRMHENARQTAWEYNYTPKRKLSKMGHILKAKKAPAGSACRQGQKL